VNTALEFLTLILPREGLYVATVFTEKRVTNHFHDTVASLTTDIHHADGMGRTVYHACASYRARTKRNQANALGARCLWGDLDLKRSTGEIVYSSKAVALDALFSFSKTYTLPLPTVNDSGYGLQYYWPFTDTLAPDEWLTYARALRAACEAAGFRPDHARTCDIASILRTPGTHNRKDPANVKPVLGGKLNGPYEKAQFASLLGVQAPRRQSSSGLSKAPVAAAAAHVTERGPADAARIARNCRQLALFFIRNGAQSEPIWFACLGVVAYCNDGDRLAHKVSSGDPRYTETDTQARLDRVRNTLTGATTCQRFEALNPEGCQGCPHRGKIKSPIALGYERETPKLDSGPQQLNGHAYLPALPENFGWSDNSLVTLSANVAGTIEICVSKHPIYLAAVQRGELKTNETTLVFHQHTKAKGDEEITISAGDFFSSHGKALMHKRGANLTNFSHFETYVKAAVDVTYENQVETRYEQFGWKQDDTSFLYGLHLYSANDIKRVIGNEELQYRCAKARVGMFPGGSLYGWQEAVRHLFRNGFEAQAFMVVNAFAAPLVKFFDPTVGGGIVHIFHKDTNKLKSTSLIAAASVWGQRDGLTLTQRDTVTTKPLTIGALGNLPVCYDEVDARDPEQMERFIIDFVEGRDRMRANRAGEIMHNELRWQTILISATNVSLVDQIVSTDMGPDAARWRVIESEASVPEGFKVTGGSQIQKQLQVNAGYAGDAYLTWLVNPEHLAWAKEQLITTEKEIWGKPAIDGEGKYRFWVRTVAAWMVAAAIVNKLEIIRFDPERIFDWAIKNNLPGIDDDSSEWRRTDTGGAVHYLNTYMDVMRGNILRMQGPFVNGQKAQVLTNEPRGSIVGRYEQRGGRIYLAQAPFREWLAGRQINYRQLVRALVDAKIVISRSNYITLGAGTDLPGGQVTCLEINGEHVAIKGTVDNVPENVIHMAR